MNTIITISYLVGDSIVLRNYYTLFHSPLSMEPSLTHFVVIFFADITSWSLYFIYLF